MSDEIIDVRTNAERRWPVSTIAWSVLCVTGLLAIVTLIAFGLANLKILFGVRSPNLQVAAVHYPRDIVPLIRDGHDVNAVVAGQTPLNHAVTFRKVQSVQLLLAHGANANLGGPDGTPPLASPFLSYTSPTSLQIVNLLLDAGADPNVHGIFGQTPLHMALSEGQDSLARRLIAAGADLTARSDLAGQTPLHVGVAKSNLALVRELLAAGADANAMAQGGTTPLMIAIREQNEPIVNALLAAGADSALPGWSPAYIENEAGTPEIRELLRRHRAAAAGTEAASPSGSP